MRILRRGPDDEGLHPLEPDVVENKYYAKGIGPVLVIAVSGGSIREELLRFEKAL